MCKFLSPALLLILFGCISASDSGNSKAVPTPTDAISVSSPEEATPSPTPTAIETITPSPTPQIVKKPETQIEMPTESKTASSMITKEMKAVQLRVDLLTKKINEVMKRPNIQPGKPKGAFWSHRLVDAVIRELGYNVDLILHEYSDGILSIDSTKPYDMAINLRDLAALNYGNVKELTAEEAAESAQRGELIVFAMVTSKRQDYETALVGIVYPQDSKEQNFSNRPRVAMAAPTVDLFTHDYLVDQIKIDTPHYYTIPLKTTQKLRGPSATYNAKRLNLKLQQVIDREEFQAGYPDADGIRAGLPLKRGSQPGVTWCQRAAYTAVSEMGYITSPMVVKNGIDWTNADAVFDCLSKAAANRDGVQLLDPAEAQFQANLGGVVIASAKSNGIFTNGHTGIVGYNEDKEYDPLIGPIIYQAGSFNGKMHYKTWVVTWKMPPLFFNLIRKNNI